MNKNSSRDYVMECLRGARRPDTLEYPQCVHDNRREVSTISVALIHSRQLRIAAAFSLFSATQVCPVAVLVRPASLRSSGPILAR